MHEQVRMLVILQDLDGQIRDFSDPARRSAEEAMGFEVNGLETLKTARAKLAAGIDRRYLLLYERVTQKHGRAVVPVEDRTCLGCFQTLPGSFFSEITAAQPVKVCENCGRILYMLNR
jgi:predicted  nucleic acid-binding Zn-ribbon protein